MKISARSPLLWVSATALSGMLYFFAFHFFPQSFPIINLSITMDLEQALDKASELAQENLIGPDGYDYAAMFHTDTTVKTFIELEAGGKDAFVTMMEEKLYMPYTWRVRHFKEHEKNEAAILFTPDGKPYGFIETVSENIPGSQLSLPEAREIAEEKGSSVWNVNFDNYTLVESSQKMEMSGRIDHTLVYEHATKKIGEGLYRLKIVVSGSKLTELTHFVKVPESFNRRYAEMRSANTTIAWAANLIMGLLYIIGGCGLGLYWIMRQRWNIIKQPIMWAVFLSSIAVLAAINQLPFLWMHYNSAQSANNFLMQLFLRLLISLLGQTALYTLIIMTAESLTRRAFGKQLQLWSINKPDVITSYSVLGKTISGYLLVGFNCAFVIGFYLFSTRYLGWWTPSEMLFDPNILATYAPWFSPIAQSLNAGFIEECLFRAIPLAGAALLGNRFGYKNWWIGAAFILQAVVFGAAHANYPMQPSYARLIELLVPSFIWGATYLRFGLLINIIAHCVYDIIWFSLPIFVSSAPHAFGHKVTIIVITMLPLAYILYARIKKGSWNNVPLSALNESWVPATITEQKEEQVHAETESHNFSTNTQKLVIGFGVLGFIAWLLITPFTHDGVQITLNRNDAVAVANMFLADNNSTLTRPWQTLPLVFTHYSLFPQIALQHKFIWREGGKETYHNLLGTYLNPAHWTIRYAQFDTDIVQRAEEHKVLFYNDNVWRYYHQLPESSAGALLNQDEARAIAHKAIQKRFNINPAILTEISATQEQLPNRKNWLFIFSNPTVYPLTSRQARVSVTIAGDEVIDAVRTIHVPEEWERNEQNAQSLVMIITIFAFLLLLFFLAWGALGAFRKTKSFAFSQQLFYTLTGSLLALSCIDIFNSWPSVIGAFNTSLPLNNQLFQAITSLLFATGMKIVFCAGTITYLLSQKKIYRLPNNRLTIGVGLSTGLLFAGVLSIARTLISTNMPLWPDYTSLGCALPLINSITSAIGNYLQITMAFSLLFVLIDTATKQWQIHRLFFTLFAALCGIAMITLPSVDALPMWIVIGTIIGWLCLTLYRFIIRYDYSLIPLATYSFTVMHITQQGIFNAYPGAVIEAIASVCAVSSISALWYWYMNKAH